MAKKFKQVGTVRINGQSYGPGDTRELLKVLPKEDLERLQKNPKVFAVAEAEEEERAEETPGGRRKSASTE